MSSNLSSRTISILVPVYQNELNLDHTFSRLQELKKSLSGRYKLNIVFVDDGSTDGSAAKLDLIQKNNNDFVRVLKFTRNFGQIAAIQAGFKHCNADLVGVISADLQDPPELFLNMISHYEDGNKLVIAERTDRDESYLQIMFSKFYWGLVNKIALPGYPTGGFDFCLVDKEIAQVLNGFSEKNTHIFPLIFSFGFPYKVIKYKRERREHGKSQWTLRKKIKLFLDTFIAFSYAPIRLISLIGIFVSSLSFLFAIYIVTSYLIQGNPYTGWTTLSTLTSFFGGLILLTLGLIGEYLWRILDQVRGRPLFIVKSDSQRSD